MELSLFPENIKKMITHLQRQLRTANLLEDLVITPNNIKYGTSIIGEELAASTTLVTSDAQKIRQNLMAYVNNLHSQDVTFQILPELEGDWEMQVKSICAEIMKVPSDPVKRLYNYYQLGAVLEKQASSEHARKEIWDFSILLEEARVMKELEFNELIDSTNELLGVTLQEVENVTN
ncbi:hypothetical protein C2G38_2155236 [Gigaspora rosea]|uniref:Uncharacterized protein n=1 Tax=Gigaspora rosea TaxID=44941 RepID=A0A397W428_9GLOM|nr:hypothetical protein C2G38_2155236 [Gigaspora rosea]